MRLNFGIQAVFLACILVLAVLPFLHGYLATSSEKLDRQERDLDIATREAVDAVTSLKETSTIFDQFVEHRAKRRGERQSEQERLLFERSRKNRNADAQQNSNGETDRPQLERIRQRIQQEQLTVSESPIEKGAVGRYAEAHRGSLPILIVCHNRPQELGETLDALLKLRNVDPWLILVSQDGTDERVKQKVVERKLALIQNTQLQSQGWAESGRRIAWHYRYSLNAAFEKFSDAPAVIILEDDLRVSPDFIDFFIAAGGVLEKDPTLWCVSAWNDNGFNDIVLASDGPYRLKRTELFPGLGWLLLRSEYDLNLRQSWPDDQWDWYVRGVYQRKERECIYPEVPRTFHAGRTGTFVNEKDQRAIFDRMARNERSDLDWLSKDALRGLHQAFSSNYDARIEALLTSPSTIHIKEPQLFEDTLAEAAGKQEVTVVVWFDADPDPKLETRLKRFTQYFGIWHQLLRASHESTHEIQFKKVRVLLINTFQPRQIRSAWFTSYGHRSKYVQWKPDGVPTFDPEEFMVMISSPLPKHIIPAVFFDEPCSDTCARENLRCDATAMPQINICSVLKTYFPCQDCILSIGDDQPCYVSADAPADKNPNVCLTNTATTFTCSGRHPLTKRLCACV